MRKQKFTRLLKKPTVPTAHALRERFPTPALLAQASVEALREAKGRTSSVSDAKLRQLEAPGGAAYREQSASPSPGPDL